MEFIAASRHHRVAAYFCHIWRICSATCIFNLATLFSAMQRADCFSEVWVCLRNMVLSFRMFLVNVLVLFVLFLFFVCVYFPSESLALTRYSERPSSHG